MKDTLAAGVEVTNSITIDKDRTIDFMGEALRVYATPKLVEDFEITCRNLLLEHLDDGEDSVGTRVAIDHSGAAMVGADVSVSAKIAAVEGRLVTFEVLATEGEEVIGKGKHLRFVVEKAKLEARLKAKAAG